MVDFAEKHIGGSGRWSFDYAQDKAIVYDYETNNEYQSYARAGPPFNPPNLPSSTAARFFVLFKHLDTAYYVFTLSFCL